MKKRMFSVLILFAMLLSVAAVSTVSGGAQKAPTTGTWTASCAQTEPVIDGAIDDVWSTTVAMPFATASYGYIKALWQEKTIYLLAEVHGCTQVDFFLSTRFYNSASTGTWSWGGNYGLTCTPTTDSSASDYKATSASFTSAVNRTATKAEVKAKETETGFIVEVKIPLSSSSEYKKVAGSDFFGLGAYVNGDYSEGNCVGIATTKRDADLGLTKSPYALYAIRTVHAAGTVTQITEETHNVVYSCCGMVKSTTEHSWGDVVIDTEPTLTTTGSQSRHCSGCEAVSEVTEIEKTTIQLLGVQTTGVADGSYDVRFVAQIAGLEAFSAVGYDVSLSYGQTLDAMSEAITKELKSSSVYTSIRAGESTETPRDGGKYLVAIAVTDIPVSEDVVYVSFVIRPFTVSTTGEKVYATGTGYRTVVLQSGTIME